MRRLVAIAMMLGALAPGPAGWASDAYAQAEQAIRDFRMRTYLQTPCEASFARFWRALRVEGTQGLVYLTTPFGGRRYFTYGAVDAEGALAKAQDHCRRDAGEHGDMVLHVLRDRALDKERRKRQFEHAERAIGQ